MKRIKYICILLIIGLSIFLIKHDLQAQAHRAEIKHNQEIQEQLNLEKLQKASDEKQRSIDELNRQKQELEQKTQDQQKQIEEKDRQLQAKRDSEARLAVARANVAPAGSSGPCARFSGIFGQYGWDVRTAIAICMAESGGNTTAVSPTDDHGLMQINHGLSIYGAGIYDPAENIRIAYEVKYLHGGWSHWTVYKTGAYLKYMS